MFGMASGRFEAKREPTALQQDVVRRRIELLLCWRAKARTAGASPVPSCPPSSTPPAKTPSIVLGIEFEREGLQGAFLRTRSVAASYSSTLEIIMAGTSLPLYRALLDSVPPAWNSPLL